MAKWVFAIMLLDLLMLLGLTSAVPLGPSYYQLICGLILLICLGILYNVFHKMAMGRHERMHAELQEVKQQLAGSDSGKP